MPAIEWKKLPVALIVIEAWSNFKQVMNKRQTNSLLEQGPCKD